jgi:hypothetical protein
MGVAVAFGLGLPRRRVTELVEIQKSFHPMAVGLLGFSRVVPASQRLSDLIK